MYLNTTAPHEPAPVERGYENAYVPPWQNTPARTETDRSDKPAYVQKFRLSKSESQAVRANQIRTLYSVDDMIESVFTKLAGLGGCHTVSSAAARLEKKAIT
jgi:hypothetical protein